MAAKKKKPRRAQNQKRGITKFILYTIFVILVGSSISLCLSLIFNKNIVLSEIFLLLSGVIFFFPFSLLVAYRYKMVNIIDKIIIPLFVVGSLLFSISWIISASKLCLDLDDYNHKNFIIIEGKPTEVTYDGSRNGPDYITSITIDDTKIKTSHLYIVEEDFKKHFYNKTIKIEYLPNSKLAITVKSIDDNNKK